MCNEGHDYKESLVRANNHLIEVCKNFKGSKWWSALHELTRQQILLLGADLNVDSTENLFALDELKNYRAKNFPSDCPISQDNNWRTYTSIMTDIKLHMLSAVLQQE